MKTRMHPSIILEKLISSFIFILLIGYSVVTSMLGDLSRAEIEATAGTLMKLGLGIYGLILLVITILLLIFTFIFWISWENTYLSFNEESLIIEKGKLFKKITTIHLADIATINITRNILEKILGTSNLKIDLNTNNETYKGKLIFKNNKAKELKDEILMRSGKQKQTENEEIESLVNYTPKDVFKHMLLSTNILSIIVLIIVYLGVILGFTLTSNTKGVFLTILPLFIIIIPIIWSLFKSYLGYHNFKCTREKDNIKLSYGALTTYKYSIPIQKINAVIIHQTIQARILNYYLIEVVNAGIGEEEEEKTIISLYVKEKEKNKIIENIIPEYQNEVIQTKGDKNVLKHYLVSKLPLIIICIIVSPYTYFISLILIPFILLIAYMQYKTKQIGNDNNLILITNGILNKRTIMVKYSNIELIQNNQKLLSKIFDTRSLQINVVGPKTSGIFISGLFKTKTIENIIKIY